MEEILATDVNNSVSHQGMEDFTKTLCQFIYWQPYVKIVEFCQLVVVVRVLFRWNDGVAALSSWGRWYEQNSVFPKKQHCSCRTKGAPHDTSQMTPELGQKNAQSSLGMSQQYWNQIPIWCHVHKSNTPSSIQKHVVALVYLKKQNE